MCTRDRSNEPNALDPSRNMSDVCIDAQFHETSIGSERHDLAHTYFPLDDGTFFESITS